MRGLWARGAAFIALAGALAAPVSAQEADVGDTPQSAAALSIGAPTNGAIEAAGDRDLFSVTLRGGQGYRFSLEAAGEPSLDPVLRLLDASGAEIAANDDAGGTLNSRIDLAAPADGTFFLEARSFDPQGTGAYTIGAIERDLPTDAVPGTPATTARLTPGASLAGAIDFDGDTDWYRAELTTGQIYQINLDGADGLDPVLRVMNAEGAEIAFNDDANGTLNSQIDFIATQAGTYFIEARNLSESGTGGYTLRMARRALPADAVRGDARTRARIAPGQSIAGTLDFGRDTDWYRAQLVAGEFYRIQLTGAGDEGALGDPLVRVLNRAGEELAVDDDGGEGLNSYLEFQAPANGAYFIEARGFGDEAQGAYTLSLARGDIPGDASTDVALSAGGDYREGRLAPAGDRDWYALNLSNGETVRIALNNASAEGLGDPMLIVYDASGAEVARDDDGGGELNSYLEFTPPSPGRYFAEARGFSDEAQGAYLITITAGEIGNDAGTADALPVATSPRLSVIGEAGDVDWFSFEAVEGRAYRIFADPAFGEGALGDPTLALYGPDGEEIARDDDGGMGLGARIAFVAPTVGAYYAAVSGFSGNTGRYAIRVSDTEVPGHGGTDEMLDAAGDTRASRIDMAGDKDWYGVELAAGQQVRITLDGAGADRLADPLLVLMNDEGEERARDDDSGPGRNAALTFTAPTAGHYFVQATSADGSTGDYTLSISEAQSRISR